MAQAMGMGYRGPLYIAIDLVDGRAYVYTRSYVIRDMGLRGVQLYSHPSFT